MKLLLFSDVHCNVQAVERLVEASMDVDVVVAAGDLGTMRRGLAKTIAALRQTPRPCVLVPGNAESDSELRAACRDWPQARVLHGQGVEVDGIPFFGLGGGIPVTPFGSWSFDLDERQAADLLQDCPPGGVLVTHSPPHGVLDVASRGVRLGSTAIRAVIERQQPRLAVCGHIHDCGGRHERLGGTDVVNAGPEGIVWELPG